MDDLFAWRPEGGRWILIDQWVTLPGYGEPDEDGHRADVQVNPAHLADLSPQMRTARGFKRVEALPEPEGVMVTGQSFIDTGDTPMMGWNSRPYTKEEKEALRLEKVSAIEAETRRRLLEVMSDTQQRNFSLMVGTRVVTHGPDVSTWPEEDRASFEANQPKVAELERLRARGKAVVAMLPKAADVVAVKSFEIDPAEWDED